VIDLETELKNTFSVSQTAENNFDIQLSLPKSLSYFVGHFPQLPILPAVGMIDLSVFLTRSIKPDLNQKHLQKIKYLKIKSPLGPDQKINIQISTPNNSEFTALWNTESGQAIAEINFVFAL
jgi:3-hydroxymyristoyl/3-hydroxydecanoyl-(acyl carrier protein) dehydratase